jgi:hypothetical protein
MFRFERFTFPIFLGVLFIYLLLPTKNYYWDGIGLAYAIENPGYEPLLHQNHLLYGPLGYAAWRATQTLLPGVRALDLLQVINSLFGAAAVAVFYRILLGAFRSSYVAAWLSLALAFSATWWKFSTDVDSYIPSIFFVLVALLLASRQKETVTILPGCVHACAMLLHQLAVFFTPVLIFVLWQKETNRTVRQKIVAIAQYGLTAAAVTMGVYAAAFAVRFGTFQLVSFLRWMTSYSQDVVLSSDIWKNAVTSLAGHVKLVLGGRLPLIRAVWNPFLVLTTATLTALTTLLVVRLRRGLKLDLKNRYPDVVRMMIVWIAVYVIFLLVWLPHNTFYRLFYLPALLMLAGTLVPAAPQRRYRLALAVAVLFFWNLGFHIYPYAQLISNPTLEMAQTLRKTWPEGTVVYWNVYGSDNRTIQYFNPQVRWKELWDRVWIRDVEQAKDTAYAGGNSFWFDLPALERFAAEDQEFRAWLTKCCRLDSAHELTLGNGRIGFVQLMPRSF